MADFVRVPETDWRNILDATRAKTGGTEKMVSGVVADAIAGIAAGGGEDALLASVLEKTCAEFTSETATQVLVARLFQACITLKKVDLPNVTKIDGYTFSGCTALSEVNLPKLETMGMANFEDCTSLTDLILPKFHKFANNSNMQRCTNLRKVDFQRKDNPLIPYENNMNQLNFNGCSSLTVLIIRAEDNIWKLGNINNFNGTPFASGGTGGTVYVPSALIESYKTATNWSTLYAAGTCNFVAIEGSEYE